MWEGESAQEGWQRENWAGAFKDGFLEVGAGYRGERNRSLMRLASLGPAVFARRLCDSSASASLPVPQGGQKGPVHKAHKAEMKGQMGWSSLCSVSTNWQAHGCWFSLFCNRVY